MSLRVVGICTGERLFNGKERKVEVGKAEILYMERGLGLIRDGTAGSVDL